LIAPVPLLASLRNWALRLSVLALAKGPLSYSTDKAALPWNAAHELSATTAMPRGTRTTSTTPLTFFAFDASNDLTVAPKIGGNNIEANFIPGTRTSMPYFAVPLTLSGVSMRLFTLPISVN
jgi:hypothetical protein